MKHLLSVKGRDFFSDYYSTRAPLPSTVSAAIARRLLYDSSRAGGVAGRKSWRTSSSRASARHRLHHCVESLESSAIASIGGQREKPITASTCMVGAVPASASQAHKCCETDQRSLLVGRSQPAFPHPSCCHRPSTGPSSISIGSHLGQRANHARKPQWVEEIGYVPTDLVLLGCCTRGTCVPGSCALSRSHAFWYL